VLRLLFQLVRADFRDPMADAIVRVTNWLIMPLRKVLPPIGKIDTATVLAVLWWPRRAPFILMALAGGGVGDVIVFLRITLLDSGGPGAARSICFAMLLYWLTSFVSPGGYAPGVRLLSQGVRTDLKARAPHDSAHRTNRFFRALGIDRDRCAACAAALNIASYMPDITVNEAQHGAANRSVAGAKPEKTSANCIEPKNLFSRLR